MLVPRCWKINTDLLPSSGEIWHEESTVGAYTWEQVGGRMKLVDEPLFQSCTPQQVEESRLRKLVKLEREERQQEGVTRENDAEQACS